MFKRSLNGEARAVRRALVPWALFVLSGLTAACGDDGGGSIDFPEDAGLDAAVVTPSSTHTAANPTHSTSPSVEPSTTVDSGSSSSAEPSTEPSSSAEPSTAIDSGTEPTTAIDSGVVPTMAIDSGVVPSAEPTLEVDGSVAPDSAMPDASAEPTLDGSVSWPDSAMPDASASAVPSEVPTYYYPPEDGGGPPSFGTWPVDGADGGVFDDGILTNGSFDLGTDEWTALVSPNGDDTFSNFSWVEEGARVASGMPYLPNAQVFYQDFTVPSGSITAATFSVYVAVSAYGYLSPETAQTLEIDPDGSTHDAFRVDIVASGGDVFSDAGAGDAGAGDAGGGNSADVFTSPILFELYAPPMPTEYYYYGAVDHVVIDSVDLASFLDSHQGETLRLRVGVVSSNFPVWGEFDNISLIVGM